MRANQSLSNFLASNGRVVIGSLLSILITPLVIKYVGDSEYGAFRVFLDIFAYFSLVDIGVYSSFIVILNKKFTKNNRVEISKTFLVAKKFYTRLFAISLIAFLLTSPIVIYLVKSENLDKGTVYYSYLIFMFSLLNLLYKAHQGYLEAKNKSSIISMGSIIQNILFSLGSLGLAFYGFGLKGLCLAFVVSSLAPYVLYYFKVRSLVSSVDVSDDDYSKELIEVNRFSKANFLVHLTGKFSLYSDTLIISLILSPVSVTYYFISSRIISLASTVPGAISSSSWAALGEIYHGGDLSKFNQYIYRISRLILISSLLFIAPLIFISRSFVSLWVGSDYYLGEFFISIVILNFFIQSVMNFWGWCLSTTHHLDHAIKMQYVGLVSNVSSSIILTFFYDESGPVLGTLFTNLFINIPWLLYLMKDIYGINIFYLLKKLSVCLILLFLCLLMSFEGKYIDVSSWSNFLFYSALTGIGFIVVVYTVVMDQDEKVFYTSLVKRFLK